MNWIVNRNNTTIFYELTNNVNHFTIFYETIRSCHYLPIHIKRINYETFSMSQYCDT